MWDKTKAHRAWLLVNTNLKLKRGEIFNNGKYSTTANLFVCMFDWFYFCVQKNTNSNSTTKTRTITNTMNKMSTKVIK